MQEEYERAMAMGDSPQRDALLAKIMGRQPWLLRQMLPAIMSEKQKEQLETLVDKAEEGATLTLLAAVNSKDTQTDDLLAPPPASPAAIGYLLTSNVFAAASIERAPSIRQSSMVLTADKTSLFDLASTRSLLSVNENTVERGTSPVEELFSTINKPMVVGNAVGSQTEHEIYDEHVPRMTVTPVHAALQTQVRSCTRILSIVRRWLSISHTQRRPCRRTNRLCPVILCSRRVAKHERSLVHRAICRRYRRPLLTAHVKRLLKSTVPIGRW
jgi:hypothetical protein